MAAKKSKPPAEPGVVQQAFMRSRWLIVAAMFVAVFATGWHFAWNRVRPHVVAREEYIVRAKDIVVTPLPPWIHSPIVDDVVKNASLSGPLSILDDELTKRLANAFSEHRWVASVHRVRKQLPTRVEVELTYLQPVAMVEVLDGNNPALLAIDAHGILLDSREFSGDHLAESKRYIPIKGIQSTPHSLSAKQAWGDVYVTGAAQIAKALGSRWQSWGLRCIVAPHRGGAQEFDIYTYQLLTRSGKQIVWGRAPGNEPKGEPSALAKVAMLEQIAGRVSSGSLDDPAMPALIDLRQADTAPRTAEKQLQLLER
jgi:hypothetical protein